MLASYRRRAPSCARVVAADGSSRDIRRATSPDGMIMSIPLWPWPCTCAAWAPPARCGWPGAIGPRAHAPHLDVFSPMPYHARFGHAADPAWIGRHVAWLGRHLGVEGRPGERRRICPIVHLSDGGEPVPAAQVAEVIGQGARPPATGVTAFAWGPLAQ